MKKYFIATTLIIIIAVLAIFLAPGQDFQYQHKKVSIGNMVFDALVADTETLRAKGLGGRPGLDKGQAMLFVFDKPNRLGFWMKDMFFSIDILWLDSDFRVVSFQTGISPATYPKVFFGDAPSQYVIEFSANTLAPLGIKAGDQVKVY